MMPSQEITDDSYMLHWKSAPAQLPRYMDGYQVLLSTNGNELSSFKDTLFTAASMEAITGDGQSVDYSNFTFTPGYLHANGGMDTTYFVAGTGINFGLLEPHSVDLSAYSGETVYIAFLHDSDDDDRIQIDDILLTKAANPTGISENLNEKYRLECYPNPANQFMNLNFKLDTKRNASYSIYSIQGKLIQQVNMGWMFTGNHTERINISGLASGTYLIRLQLDDESITNSFTKK